MKKLEGEIQQLLLKSLPEQTAGLMKSFIEEADNLKEEYEKVLKVKEKQEQDIKLLKEEKAKVESELEYILTKVNDLETRELKLNYINEDLIKKANEQNVFELKCKLDASETVNAKYAEFLALLVKNPVTQKFWEHKQYSPGGYTHNKDGSTTYYNSGDTHESERTTQEQTKI